MYFYIFWYNLVYNLAVPFPKVHLAVPFLTSYERYYISS